MNSVLFLSDYVQWHYGAAFFDILRIWRNFLWLTVHYFSTGLLLKTFFSPWRRIHEERPKKGTFSLSYYLGIFVVNTMMRIVGALARSIIIVISLIVLGAMLAFGIIFLLFWIIAPLAIFLLFFTGLGSIFV